MVSYDLFNRPYETVLVINATRHLVKLWRCKKRGARIVQRLGAINWLHLYLSVNLGEVVLAEGRNIIMRLIRSRIADHIVYQSNFVRNWWNNRCGVSKAPSTIIYNGADLKIFSPEGAAYKSEGEVCIISVEGTQGADPFDIAIRLAQGLQEAGLDVELLMFGSSFKDAHARYSRYPFVKFKGSVPNKELPYYYRGASFYVSTDILTAACPNSVLEALACGHTCVGLQARSST
ncbi:MAG: hypothetical protein KatS3mg081_0020 [Gemmatimonadales bacterium]|nr:MAG: hypothetical protein KatS3mg081_0020 [Gemmatimonadales bacterium]